MKINFKLENEGQCPITCGDRVEIQKIRVNPSILSYIAMMSVLWLSSLGDRSSSRIFQS